jgi:hypothetical protein
MMGNKRAPLPESGGGALESRSAESDDLDIPLDGSKFGGGNSLGDRAGAAGGLYYRATGHTLRRGVLPSGSGSDQLPRGRHQLFNGPKALKRRTFKGPFMKAQKDLVHATCTPPKKN